MLGDVKLKVDGEGKEYLEFTDSRAVTWKLWENTANKDRCPIQVYKEYEQRRPVDFKKEHLPFYIAAAAQFAPHHKCWFMRQPVGENKMRSMAKTLKTGKRLTNKRSLKTRVEKLPDQIIHDASLTDDIVHITGNKTVKSVLNYANLKEPAHKRLSSFKYSHAACKKSRSSATASSTASQQASDSTPSCQKATVTPSATSETTSLSTFPSTNSQGSATGM